MPYNRASDLPAAVKKHVRSAKRRRQFVHVFNSIYKKTGSESRAFAGAYSRTKEQEQDMSIKVATKAAKVTLYSGADDPDLPNHVRTFPSRVRSTWSNMHNWHVQEAQDNDAAAEYADSATHMSLSEIMDHFGTKKELDDVGDVDDTVDTAVQPDASPSMLERFKQWLGLGRPELELTGPFMVFKDKNDQWRIFTVYSNQFEDQHGEVISEVSHKEYVDWVTRTKAYPDFHLWHGGPGTKFGTVDFVDYVDGFAIASGPVDQGKEHIAVKLKEKADKGEIAVSHGFLGRMVEKGVYDRHRTFEISPLPRNKEANPWTSLNLLAMKEADLTIPAEKRPFYKEFGFSDEAIDSLGSKLTEMRKSLIDANVRHKEETPTPPTPPPTPPAPQPEPPAPTPPTPPAPQASGDALALNLAEMATGITEMAKGLTELRTEFLAFKEAANKPVEQRAEDMVLAKVAASINGGGHSPTRSAGNLVSKEKAMSPDDWLRNVDFLGGFTGPVAGNGAVMTAIPQGGEGTK